MPKAAPIFFFVFHYFYSKAYRSREFIELWWDLHFQMLGLFSTLGTCVGPIDFEAPKMCYKVPFFMPPLPREKFCVTQKNFTVKFRGEKNSEISMNEKNAKRWNEINEWKSTSKRFGLLKKEFRVEPVGFGCHSCRLLPLFICRLSCFSSAFCDGIFFRRKQDDLTVCLSYTHPATSSCLIKRRRFFPFQKHIT